MEIKIIRGTYGFKQGANVAISPKTVKDPPFKVDEAEAKRLIALGVAAPADNEQAEENDNDPPYSKDMSLKELQKIATEYGIENAEKINTKDKVIAAIDEVLND